MDATSREAVRILSRRPTALVNLPDAAARNALATFVIPSETSPPWPAVVVGAASTPSTGLQCGDCLARSGVAALVLKPALNRWRRFSTALASVDLAGLADVFAGYRWLAGRPEIQATSIHLVSLHSGLATLAVYEQIRRLFAGENSAFASHMAIDDPAAVRLEDYRTTGAPITRLDTIDAHSTRQKRRDLITGDLRNGGSTVSRQTIDTAPSEPTGRAPITFPLPRLRWDPVAVRIDPANRLLAEHSGRPITGWYGEVDATVRALRLKTADTGAPVVAGPDCAAWMLAHLRTLDGYRRAKTTAPGETVGD